MYSIAAFRFVIFTLTRLCCKCVSDVSRDTYRGIPYCGCTYNIHALRCLWCVQLLGYNISNLIVSDLRCCFFLLWHDLVILNAVVVCSRLLWWPTCSQWILYLRFILVLPQYTISHTTIYNFTYHDISPVAIYNVHTWATIMYQL